MSRSARAVLMTMCFVGTASCGGGGGAKDIWSKFLKQCAEGEQIRNVLFFSTSNTLGPGSLWSRSEKNGYIPVRKMVAAPADVLEPGATGSCAGARITTSSVGFALGADKLMSLVPVNLSTDLTRASKVAVTASNWRWDNILVGPYRDWIQQVMTNDPGNAYVRDLNRDSLLVGRAVRLVGLTADLDFGRGVAGELKAKYPAGVDLEGKVTGKWTDSLTMHIAVADTVPVYVGVVLYKWTGSGFQSGAPEVVLPSDAVAMAGDPAE